MKVYDCFSYLDEDLLLDLRLNILDQHVDYFVIVESNRTWQNNHKDHKFDISRFKKLQGNQVFFLTGTDEHGQKVQEAAKKRNVQPKEHVDEYVKRFKATWENLNIDYDYFIRTTDKNHTERVKQILADLYKKGDIYFDEYEGLYSVSEERFITEKEKEEGNFRQIKNSESICRNWS